MKKIAVEEHFTSNEYLDYLKALFEKENPVSGLRPEDDAELRGWVFADHSSRVDDVGEGRLEDMDRNGIDMQVLSLVPGVQALDADRGNMMARKLNDRLSEIVKERPDRFAGFATIASQEPEGAAAELKRAVTELGLKGTMIFSNVQGEYLDNRKFWPIFEMAEKLGVPVYIHPNQPSADMIKPYLTYPVLTGAMHGFAAEVSLHALRLICSGLFDEYPELQIILGHMGEALPYWLWRMDKHWPRSPLSQKLKKMPSQYIKDNFYITTSGMFWVPALMCAYLALGADRILFAVDYPPESCEEAVKFIDSIPISDVDKEKICHLNAEKLFSLK